MNGDLLECARCPHLSGRHRPDGCSGGESTAARKEGCACSGFSTDKPRYILIPIQQVNRAVVDADTGTYYGIAENDRHLWGARDWEGLSLPAGFADSRTPKDYATYEYWADRLIERAVRKGLPKPQNPDMARGVQDGFLFMYSSPVEDHDAVLHAYTVQGRYLGIVYYDAPHGDMRGRWRAVRRVPGSFTSVVHIGTADGRVGAAQCLLDTIEEEG